MATCLPKNVALGERRLLTNYRWKKDPFCSILIMNGKHCIHWGPCLILFLSHPSSSLDYKVHPGSQTRTENIKVNFFVFIVTPSNSWQYKCHNVKQLGSLDCELADMATCLPRNVALGERRLLSDRSWKKDRQKYYTTLPLAFDSCHVNCHGWHYLANQRAPWIYLS